MIYTVTLNPAIDYIIHSEKVELGELNRLDSDTKLPGGKGINVSRVLQQFQEPNTALGFIGGFPGKFIQDCLEKEQVLTHFIQVQEDTRINVKLKSISETEFNAQGPTIQAKEAEALLKQMDQLTDQDIVILSGNKQGSLPDDYYEKMILRIQQAGARFVIDTTGKEMIAALAYHPLLVKPNHHELAELFHTSFASMQDMIPYGKQLIQAGAQHAIISMGGDGALFFTDGAVYHATVPKGHVLNSVGAGDSMIAGFIAAFVQTQDPMTAFKTSVATGSATAFSQDLATKEKIEQLLPSVSVNKISE
ncbi:1-phosphofructokinase [Pisciglobus halotolerans]|uniref:Tagatose-6-phosphate kinase n=1 Tax=Pisciglobus halotolerans TaxID=745365 RepID=A0A1I3AM63_9LACT|nr:1-phosphofructokinase [Pisciglobus halotolerans]SFH51072.1 fructose-1-phosphate kinase [Pisciglobus halotolerans]